LLVHEIELPTPNDVFYIFRRPDKVMTVNGKKVINMASMNFLGFLGDESIEVKVKLSYHL